MSARITSETTLGELEALLAPFHGVRVCFLTPDGVHVFGRRGADDYRTAIRPSLVEALAAFIEGDK